MACQTGDFVVEIVVIFRDWQVVIGAGEVAFFSDHEAVLNIYTVWLYNQYYTCKYMKMKEIRSSVSSFFQFMTGAWMRFYRLPGPGPG